MKQADGYYSLADFASKLRTMSTYALEVEWFCRKAGRSDLVYGEQYDAAIHLVDAAFRPDLPALLSIDWGGTNPFAVGVWQPLDIGWTMVDEVYRGNTTNSVILAECKRRAWWANVPKVDGNKTGGVADPSRPDLFKEWLAAGVKLVEADNNVDKGIEAVRAALRPVIGQPRFRVSLVCNNWKREMGSYIQRKGKPIKENDHLLDAVRYFVLWQIADIMAARKGRVWAPGITDKPPADDKKAPSPPPAAPPEKEKQHEPTEIIRTSRRGRVFVPGR